MNIPVLLERFDRVVTERKLADIVTELVIQSRLEFNLPVDETTEASEDHLANCLKPDAPKYAGCRRR